MSGEVESNRTEQDAEFYIKLGKLLQKKRSEQALNAVNQIVASSKPIPEKVAEIEKLDKEADAAFSAPESATPVQKTETPKKNPAFATVQSAEVEQAEEIPVETIQKFNTKKSVTETLHNRINVAVSVLPVSLLPYIFNERRKIVQFSEKTALLEMGLLPFYPHFNKKTLVYLGDFLRSKIIPHAKESVKKALEKGWRVLRKYEYNVIAAYARLIEEVEHLNMRVFTTSSVHDTNQTFILENYFLTFYAKKDILHKLFSSLSEALSVTEANSPDAPKTIISLEEINKSVMIAKQLLIESSAHPTFYDFIIALNIIRTHRFVTLDQIINQQCGVLFSATEFDCSPKVQAEIDKKLTELFARMKNLEDKKKKDLAFNGYFPRNNHKQIDYTLLKSLIKPASLAEGNEDVIRCISDIVQKWEQKYIPILQRQITTAEIETVRLLSEGALDFEMDKLRYLIDSLTKSTKTFPFSRFTSVRSGSATTNNAEAENVRLLSSASDLFWKMGVKIAEQSIRLSMTKDDAAFNLLDYFILDDRTGTGCTAGQFLKDAASTAFCIAYYCQNNQVMGAVDQELFIIDEMKQILRTVERLGNADQFTKMRERFGLFEM